MNFQAISFQKLLQYYLVTFQNDFLRRLGCSILPCSGVVTVRLKVELLDNGPLEFLLILFSPRLSSSLLALSGDLGQHAGSLLATHDSYLRIGPGEQESGPTEYKYYRILFHNNSGSVRSVVRIQTVTWWPRQNTDLYYS